MTCLDSIKSLFVHSISRRIEMSKILIGFVLGLVVSAVGFSGIARMFDRGVQTIQTQSRELAQ
jgi:hypothetical protein